MSSTCVICSGLADKEYALQKFGNDDISTYLPDIAEKLILTIDLKPSNERKLQIKRCPECGTYYLYETDYEYLVNGSEDEQKLLRLTDLEADKYLNHNK